MYAILVQQTRNEIVANKTLGAILGMSMHVNIFPLLGSRELITMICNYVLARFFVAFSKASAGCWLLDIQNLVLICYALSWQKIYCVLHSIQYKTDDVIQLHLVI